jgi:hypothetical protein
VLRISIIWRDEGDAVTLRDAALPIIMWACMSLGGCLQYRSRMLSKGIPVDTDRKAAASRLRWSDPRHASREQHSHRR